MEVLESVPAFSAEMDAVRMVGQDVGLVPTMGALHPGHRSLIDRARSMCGHVAVSIFVNPLQFGDPEDIERYPNTFEQDEAECAAAGVDTILVPAISELYPDWPCTPTTVTVRGPAAGWEGASRPGHFEGVATVVAKLFAITGRCRAFFGEKDFQQLQVIKQMVGDLFFPIEIVACPTVREADGLALSSRNSRLSPEGRRAATVLHRALQEGVRLVGCGESRPEAVVEVMRLAVHQEPLAHLDYAAVVDPRTLDVPGGLRRGDPVRLLIAVIIDQVRLIDNCGAVVDESGSRRTASTRLSPAGAVNQRGVL